MQMGRRRVLGLVPALGVAACTKEVQPGAPSETPTVTPSSTQTVAPSSTATSTPSEPPPALPAKVTSKTIPGASGAADITSLRYQTPRVKPAGVKASGAALQRFAARLWNTLPDTDSSLVVSPYGLAAMLGILGMGADGELRKQYETVLDGDIETVATQLTAIETVIEKAVADGLEVVKKQKRQYPEETQEQNPLWKQVNALFMDRKTEFSPEFLRRVAAGLGAFGYQVDFARDPNGSRAAVNAFVAKQTRGMVDPILGEKAVSRETGLMALSTLWLRFTWICGTEKNPNELSFKGKNGETRVPAVLFPTRGRRSAGDGWKSATAFARWSQLGVTFIVPDRWPQTLTAETIAAACGAPEAVFRVFMPKFQVSGEPDLKKALPAMGLKDAFSAEYRGFADSPVPLSDAVQKCTVSLDDTGMKGAKKEYKPMTCLGCDEQPTERLVLDRPFWFVVHDLKSNAPLYVGSVVDPK